MENQSPVLKATIVSKVQSLQKLVHRDTFKNLIEGQAVTNVHLDNTVIHMKIMAESLSLCHVHLVTTVQKRLSLVINTLVQLGQFVLILVQKSNPSA